MKHSEKKNNSKMMIEMIGIHLFLMSYCGSCGNIGVVDAFPLVGKKLFVKQQRTLLYYTNDGGDSPWSLEHDWTLLDQVPKFTVGENSQIRTFWSQLAASTPIFADKDPEELYQRCQQLSKKEGDETTTKENDEPSLILSSLSLPSPLLFGPSPPLLHDWLIEKKEQSLSTEVIGQTEDGRTIWLQYHCLGRLQGDPLSKKIADAVAARKSLTVAQPPQQPSLLLPGGYIETIGGRIYELGQTQTNMFVNSRSATVSAATIKLVTRMTNDNIINIYSWLNNNDHRQERFECSNEDDNEDNPLHSILSAASTATLSAVLASSILSASIGYATATAIVSDNYSPSTPCVHAVSSGRTATSAAAVAPTPSTAIDASIHEKRASTEYMVLREQRLLKEISQRLEKDTMDLGELHLAEQKIAN